MFKRDDILQKAELKQAPFSVPEGYFDSLQGRVMQRVAQSSRQGRPHTVSFKRWWPAAAAACVALIAAVSLLLRTSLPSDATADADEELIETVSGFLDLKAESIADYSAGEEETFSQEAIIEYLAYTGISSEYLYEQLAEAE